MDTEKSIEPIVNRVANSGLITIDLAEYYPNDDFVELDLKDWLFMGMILKEADFREKVSTFDFNQFTNKHICIVNSADSIIPAWAYMILTQKIISAGGLVSKGNKADIFASVYCQNITKSILPNNFEDSKLVIKGCGDKFTPPEAFMKVTEILSLVAKSIMYGEPCSSVPVYKKRIPKVLE